MCIAILKTKKGVITDEELKESFNSNRDGAGIAYTKNNKLYIVKGLFKVEDFIKAVRNAEKVCDNNMLIHCRIGTSGKKDASNTHPFLVNDNVALIHNGVLSIDVPKNSPKNDTQLFIERYLKGLRTKDLLNNKGLHKLIEEAIGKNNKFVLLDNTGRYKIINEKQGHWKDNVWFSNNSYKRFKYTTYFGYDYDDEDWETRWYNGGYANCTQKSLFNQQPTDRVEEVKKTKSFQDYGLTVSDMYDIEYNILNLPIEEFAQLDVYPVLNLETKKLITYEYASAYLEEDEYAFLEDVSEDLFELYVDNFETAQEMLGMLYENNTEVA